MLRWSLSSIGLSTMCSQCANKLQTLLHFAPFVRLNRYGFCESRELVQVVSRWRKLPTKISQEFVAVLRRILIARVVATVVSFRVKALDHSKSVPLSLSEIRLKKYDQVASHDCLLSSIMQLVRQNAPQRCWFLWVVLNVLQRSSLRTLAQRLENHWLSAEILLAPLINFCPERTGYGKIRREPRISYCLNEPGEPRDDLTHFLSRSAVDRGVGWSI